MANGDCKGKNLLLCYIKTFNFDVSRCKFFLFFIIIIFLLSEDSQLFGLNKSLWPRVKSDKHL